MTNAVSVFPPGYRLTDSTTGAPLSGAVIRFFDAGTTTPKTVYSDAALTTALGTSVTTDSLGYPTSDGSTKTLVYVDDASYKVTIETSAAVVIATHDNVKGAVEASTGGGGGAVVSTRTVETKSLDYTVLTTDEGKVFRSNCTGGDVAFTLPSAAAADVGNGWFITIAHAGTANQTVIETVSSQTITSGALSYSTKMTLAVQGEEVTLVSDGGNWVAFSHTGPLPKLGPGIIPVADRLAAAPVSPAEGAVYISTGAATWGSTSVANHDLVLHTEGGAYVKLTPPTDCGWVAFVQDEDLNYQFKGSAWVAETGTTSAPGTLELATAAEMVTGTDTGRVPSVSVVRNHPGVAKAWGLVTYSGGTPTLGVNYNVTSITDTATGRLTVTIADDFSSANYTVLAIAEDSTSNTRFMMVSSGTRAAGSFEINVQTAGGSLSDPAAIHFACYGTLA